jgi:hypothetical protein
MVVATVKDFTIVDIAVMSSLSLRRIHRRTRRRATSAVSRRTEMIMRDAGR